MFIEVAVKVKYGSIDLTVYGEFDKGTFGGHDTPPEASEFEISSIWIKDVDITELLEEDMIDKIEKMAHDKLKN